MVELVTQQEAEVYIVPLGRKVRREQIVKYISLNATVPNLSSFVVSRSYFSHCTVIGCVSIDTRLLAEHEVILLSPRQLWAVFGIGIAKNAIGMLIEFVVVGPPIRVVKVCNASETYL